MKSLFQPEGQSEIVERLGALEAECSRQWGKMTPAQMLSHCAIALEVGAGERPMKQKFIGKILVPFIRSSVFGEKPFGKNSPTDPTFVVSDAHDFATERTRLTSLIDRFVARGEDAAGKETHPFFGKLTGSEWGLLMYKHIDHHLRQFGR
ncbi:MAG TPA: DUF1569 domain-containing protein [Thermoanaerobaculia bacterium]|nr:DUF1569 domain-containing protein [Thermoanaerobaculia bacterium]